MLLSLKLNPADVQVSNPFPLIPPFFIDLFKKGTWSLHPEVSVNVVR